MILTDIYRCRFDSINNYLFIQFKVKMVRIRRSKTNNKFFMDIPKIKREKYEKKFKKQFEFIEKESFYGISKEKDSP